MKFPIKVKSINFSEDEKFTEKNKFGSGCGTMVAVRPCGEKYQGKTYLGILLGELALSTYVNFNRETGELNINPAMYNPMIFIPSANSVVFGVGSYWHKIENEYQLNDITDVDIENVWYVKAMKQLLKEEAL